MQVAATSLVAEHIGPLIDMFTARDEASESRSSRRPAPSFADLLEHRRADIALGPHPGPSARRRSPRRRSCAAG